MNIYFSSFQKSRGGGGRSPPEKFEGGHVPLSRFPGIAAYSSNSGVARICKQGAKAREGFEGGTMVGRFLKIRV